MKEADLFRRYFTMNMVLTLAVLAAIAVFDEIADEKPGRLPEPGPRRYPPGYWLPK